MVKAINNEGRCVPRAQKSGFSMSGILPVAILPLRPGGRHGIPNLSGMDTTHALASSAPQRFVAGVPHPAPAHRLGLPDMARVPNSLASLSRAQSRYHDVNMVRGRVRQAAQLLVQSCHHSDLHGRR